MLTRQYTFISLLAIATLLVFCAAAVKANEHFSPFTKWQTIESSHFRVNFQEADTLLASKAIQTAETLYPELSAFFDHHPLDKIELVVSDQQDKPNGYASPLPYNRVVIFSARPKGQVELNSSKDWLYTLLKHELSHTFHLDKVSHLPLALRSIFGRGLFLFPSLFQPNFLKEGLATYIETDWDKNEGRGQSPYYNMVLRSEVHDKLLPLGKLQQFNRDWPFNQSYSYGVAFYQFLDESQGHESIPGIISDLSGQIVPFQLDSPFRYNTHFKSIEQTWSAFQTWLIDRYQASITSREQLGLNKVKLLTSQAYLASAPYSDQAQNVFFSAMQAYQPFYLYQRASTGTTEQLVRTHGTVSIAGKVDNRLWYFQESHCDHLSKSFDLYELDIDSKSAKRLSQCQHYLDGDVRLNQHGNPSFIALKQVNGQDEIVQYDSANQQEVSIVKAKQGVQFASPRWLKSKNKIIYTKKIATDNWHIVTRDLGSNAEQIVLLEAGVNFFSVRPDHTETTLYIDSDKNQSIEIWQSQLDGSHLTQMTRSIGGASSGFPAHNGETMTYRYYDHTGWNIAQTPLQAVTNASSTLPDIKKPGKGYSPEITTTSPNLKTSTPAPYSAFDTVAPQSWFFAFSSDKAHTTASLILDGRDTLNFHNWALNFGRDFENDLPVYQGSYTLYNHLNLSFDRYYEYQIGDSNGPSSFIDKARTQERHTEYSASLFYHEPFEFGLGGIYFGMNVNDQEFEDLSTESLFYDKRVATIGFGLSYNSATVPFLALGPSSGRSIKATIERDDIRGNSHQSGPAPFDSSGNVWSFEWTEYFQLYQAHRLALRAFKAYADKGADYYDLSGGAPNSLFTDRLFHHRERTLRGYPDGSPELISRKPAILSADYEFPLWRVDSGIEGWPIGMYDLSGTLFHESAEANQRAERLDATGLELNLGLDLGYGLLPLNITAGAALPHEETLANRQKDANLYFKIGLGL